MTYVRMADAAFAANIPPGFDVAAGYYGGPNAYNVWARADWARFPGNKLPIWVGGENGADEGESAALELQRLGVPSGCLTVLDMEARKDLTYVEAFAIQIDHIGGYKTLVYGSASTVFGNPQVNGYWVADYTSDMHTIDGLLQHPGVRAVQFAADVAPGYDVSLVKAWTEGEMWHG